MAFNERSLDDYIEVSERIEHFRIVHPGGSLRGDWRMVQVGDQHLVAYRAEAWRTPDDLAPGVGCAWELVPGRTPYTRGSELQNAETSAWGRAIIAVGASDAKRGIASREEVASRRAEREDGRHMTAFGLSRTGVPDEVLDANGEMTRAQAREHGALAKGADGKLPAAERAKLRHLKAAAPDDPFYDQPAVERDHDSSGTITRAQQSAMHAKFGELGVTDRGERLRVTRETLGVPGLSSSSDLSYRQAGDLLEALETLAREAKR